MNAFEERPSPNENTLPAKKMSAVSSGLRPYTERSIRLSLITLIGCVFISTLHFITTNAYPDSDASETIAMSALTIKNGLAIAVALLALVTVAYWNMASQIEGEPMATAISHILNLVTGALLVLGLLLWKIFGRLT